MRFYFDIDDSEFEDESGLNFRETIKNRAIDSLADDIYHSVSNVDGWYSSVRERINELLKSRQDEIIEAVIERVSEKIAKKKEIIAITPKATELAAADKDNIAYFEQMIDKAIARRFGK